MLHALYASRAFFICIDNSSAACKNHRCDSLQFRYLMPESVDVVVSHCPFSSFSEAVVGYGCLVGKDHHAVGGEAFEILSQLFLQSLSSSDENDEHEDA